MLTPAPTEILRRFLVLLVAKLSSSNEITPNSETDTLCLDLVATSGSSSEAIVIEQALNDNTSDISEVNSHIW